MKTAGLTSLFIAATTAFLAGCATSKLWEADHFARFGEPAPEANLRLFRSNENREVLVEYDELAPWKGDIRRRAYFLYENDARVRALKKPRFLIRSATGGLEPIPVLLQPQTETEPVAQLYAVVSTNGHKFTLFAPGDRPGTAYDLPTYRTSSGRLTQVLLTPPALVADATIVGGFLVLLCWPVGYSFGL
jgi:hypothetical protein